MKEVVPGRWYQSRRRRHGFRNPAEAAPLLAKAPGRTAPKTRPTEPARIPCGGQQHIACPPNHVRPCVGRTTDAIFSGWTRTSFKRNQNGGASLLFQGSLRAVLKRVKFAFAEDRRKPSPFTLPSLEDASCPTRTSRIVAYLVSLSFIGVCG